MIEPLYALSIRQPWAALVVAGRKTIEVRTWPTRRRGRILIHAGKLPDRRPEAWACLGGDRRLRELASLSGGVVGIGELTDCLIYTTKARFATDASRHLNDPAWFRKPHLYGFVITQARPIPFHQYLGNTFFFLVDDFEFSERRAPVADWAIYWPQYPNESGETGEPVTGWLTSRDWLVNRLHPGDRLWLFIGGDACGDEEAPYRAYVAQLLVVDDWGNNATNEQTGSVVPKYRIRGIVDRCILVEPPTLVDTIFRRAESDATLHIGLGRQTPFKLDDGQVAELLTLLREQRPDVYAVATQV